MGLLARLIFFTYVVTYLVGCLSSGGSDKASAPVSKPDYFAPDWAGTYSIAPNSCEVRSGSWVCDSTVPHGSCTTMPGFTDIQFTIDPSAKSVHFLFSDAVMEDGGESISDTGNYSAQINFPDYNWSFTLVTLSRFPGMADPFVAPARATQDSVIAVFAPGCVVQYVRTVPL